MINEFCFYRIRDGKMRPFLDRFRDDAAHLMQKHGFSIAAAWETEDDCQAAFVYLLTWENDETRLAAWKAFRADPEWSEAKARTGSDHGRLIADIRQWTLRPADFSEAIAR